jgi:hypothetical protein
MLFTPYSASVPAYLVVPLWFFRIIGAKGGDRKAAIQRGFLVTPVNM